MSIHSTYSLVLYATTTMLLGTGVSAIALNVACPVGHAPWRDGDENKMPFCTKESWVAKKCKGVLTMYLPGGLIYFYIVQKVLIPYSTIFSR
jgi:hypothetical protein